MNLGTLLILAGLIYAAVVTMPYGLIILAGVAWLVTIDLRGQ